MSDSRDLGPNTALIDEPGSREKLITPALVLDLDAMERNIERMATFSKEKGVALRPHSKTHKSLAIARLQVEAGALGVCCATLGEAEVMAGGGINDVLITSPVVSDRKIEVLIALNTRAEGLMCVVDDMTNLQSMDAAAGQAGKPLSVVVDIDAGLHRTGAATAADSVALAKAAAAADNLHYAGVQSYAGHVQHIENFAARRQASADNLAVLRETLEALASDGPQPGIITGAGTGTHDIDAEMGLFTELQVGSYAVMDVEYLDVEPGGEAWRFEPALFVRARVVSANHVGSATIDAGLKCFATDGPKPTFAQGTPVGASYEYFGDEHGRVVFAGANERLLPGDAVECVVPHCDPTVNLYDVYHCVRGDTLVDIWPVDARGRH